MKYIIINKNAEYHCEYPSCEYSFTLNDPDETKVIVDEFQFHNYELGDSYDLQLPNSFLEAVIEIKNKDIKKLESKVERLQVGYNRYEKLRRLSPTEFKKLFKKNLTSGIPFDILVDQL